MKRIVSFIVLALLIAGCIQPPVKLGCCLKVNATLVPEGERGCVLYNMTDFQEYDYRDATNGPCDSPDYNTTGLCNVTVDGHDYMIPICTEDDIVPCIGADCTAMVCGDYSYKPRVAPGFISIDESAGDIPPDVQEEEVATEFYKAQCRFLPMDAKLRQIMKNTKSDINVFRVGVGGSFDEFDQYRYFFPMSDKYCTINPPRDPSDLRIDRYMNYLDADSEPFDPINEITENCLDETAGDAPAPFGFTELWETRESDWDGYGEVSYETVLPDRSNYNFDHYGRVDRAAEWVSGPGETPGYRYYDRYFDQSGVYKKIDEQYYKRELSIAHVGTIYDLDDLGISRAPFECDQAGLDCYSGYCDTSIYNRVTLAEYPGIYEGGKEVATDCTTLELAPGHTRVVCAPLKNIIENPGSPPTRTYASVDAVASHWEGEFYHGYALDNAWYGYQDFADDEELLDERWDNFNESEFAQNSIEGNVTTIVNSAIDMFGDDNHSEFSEAAYGPPVGGITFFGTPAGEEIKWHGQTVTGYVIAEPGEFENTWFAKKCNIDTEELMELPDPEPTMECQSLCHYFCPDVEVEIGETDPCFDYCEGNIPLPCTPDIEGAPRETKDYVHIEVDDPSGPMWQALMQSFKPYLHANIDYLTSQGFEDGCGTGINAYDPIIISMPWVIGHEKGIRNSLTYDEIYEDTYLTSLPGQALRQRNVYDEEMVSTRDTTSCELRRSGTYWSPWGGTPYYNVVYSKHIYLIKYNETTGKIGDCAIDEVSNMPETRTYGWCRPCTLSTLAYQNITAWDRAYVPDEMANIQDEETTNELGVCEYSYSTGGSGFKKYRINDISCENMYIPDIDDYAGDLARNGAPRTVPEASVMKERLGNYMKSGIMPILDLSDDSNWDLANPDYEEPPDVGGDLFSEIVALHVAPQIYSEYDFEGLIGTMGAAIIIVESFEGEATTEELDNIVERSNIIRERCDGCLTAFHVIDADTSSSFNESIRSVFRTDPSTLFSVDMVTFDFPASERLGIILGGKGLATQLTQYGRVALQEAGKPTMIVGFNMQTYPGEGRELYERVFTELMEEQDELIQAGIIGIIYSPVRTYGATSEGLVRIDGTGVGRKEEKFCAFQKGVERMGSTPPTSLFTKSLVLDGVNCTRCTSLDVLNDNCDMTCDNGIECGLPEGVTDGEGDYKCPDYSLVAPCQLCNESGGRYYCNVTYTNGTVEPIDGDMSDLSSDLYLDIIGSIESPDKCCLRDSRSGANYSYTKRSIASPINKPLTFPKSGHPEADCSFGMDAGDLDAITSFCGMDLLSVKDYDLKCIVEGD